MGKSIHTRGTIRCGDPATLEQAQVQEIEAVIRNCFSRTPGHGYVRSMKEAVFYELNGAVVAVVLLSCTAPFLDGTSAEARLVFLRSLCVLQSHRRQGIGSLLLQHLHLRGTWAALHVDRDDRHDRLIAWYTRRGYVCVEHTKRVPLDPAVESFLVSTTVPEEIRELL
eukprot:2402899-Rhodomonas_salina.2